MIPAHDFTDPFGGTLELSAHDGAGVIITCHDDRKSVDIAVPHGNIPALIEWLGAAYKAGQ